MSNELRVLVLLILYGLLALYAGCPPPDSGSSRLAEAGRP